MLDINYFDRIRIGLASPEQIRAWSSGEVKKPETINYRTLKPEREGLFCEKIFGPTRDWECHCGKYKRVRYKGIVCDRCGVEVTRAKVRRERMGHIELAAPVSHIWFFKGIPSRMGLILDMSPRTLEKVLYFASYIVIDPGDPAVTGLTKQQLLSEAEYREYRDKYGSAFEAGIGAEAIKKLLQELDLDELSAELRREIAQSSGQRRVRAVRRLEVVEAFRASGNDPAWMILDVIPVIPPEQMCIRDRDYMDVSPKQIVSIATALIPFLENDDGARALMGANMQRQAVPLIETEAPIVGTGMEYRAAVDSGAVLLCKNDGVVERITGREIVVRTAQGQELSLIHI